MDWTIVESTRLFIAINMLIVGISHATQPAAWARFFAALAEKRTTGAFVNGLLHLGFGTLIVAFHPVYAGWPLVLTIYGWLLVIKGTICFVAPQVALRSLEFGSKRASSFRWVGAALAMLGAGTLATLLGPV